MLQWKMCIARIEMSFFFSLFIRTSFFLRDCINAHLDSQLRNERNIFPFLLLFLKYGWNEIYILNRIFHFSFVLTENLFRDFFIFYIYFYFIFCVLIIIWYGQLLGSILINYFIYDFCPTFLKFICVSDNAQELEVHQCKYFGNCIAPGPGAVW